jgi:hypothetical protein
MARQHSVYPPLVLNVKPGGPMAGSRGEFPRDIANPAQRGIVTRYDVPDGFWLAEQVARMLADPAVVAWAAANSVSGGQMTALGPLLQAAVTPKATKENFASMASTEAHDVAHATGTVT